MRTAAPLSVDEAAVWTVGDVRVDLRYRRVIRPDGQVELPQRMFDLLMVFLAEPGVLHTRDVLFERVWPGVIVEDSNLSQSVWMLRKALGEDRKHWIRTVSKRGYVFEPPGPIEPERAPPAGTHAPDAASPEASAVAVIETQMTQTAHAIADAPPVAAAAARPRTRRWHAALWTPLALLALWGVLFAAVMAPPPDGKAIGTSPAAHPAMMIAVLQADGATDARVPRWPVDLLDAWLNWKLDLLPEVVRLDSLPDDARDGSLHVVVLSVETPADGNGRDVILSARIGDGATAGTTRAPDTTLSLRGSLDEVPAMVDTLSQRVLARVLPHRAETRWPPLSLPTRVAERYAASVDALRRRDWARARTEAEAVAVAAPHFGPVHLLLADVAMQGNRLREALGHMGSARTGLAPMPADALRIIDARSAWLDPRRQADAMRVHAALDAEYPSRPDIRLFHARLKLQAGDPRAALALLSNDGATLRYPPALRLRRLLVLAEVEGTRGYPARAREHAQQALALLATLGPGWDTERAATRLVLARIHHGEPGRAPSPSLFELAASDYERAGDSLGALYARYLAEEARKDDKPGMTANMRALREEARRAGYANIEIELLRREAFRHYNAGSHASYRTLLQEALLVANASGDTRLQNMLDLDLLNEDTLMGNDASARARIERVLAGGFTDARSHWAIQFDALLRQRTGDFAGALARLDAGERLIAERGQPLPAIAGAQLACGRADILLTRGDVPAARELLDTCRGPEVPHLRLSAQMLDAQADLLQGDSAQARVRLGEVERTIEAMPRGADYWIAVEIAAGLLARVREYDRAERLYAAALPRCEEAGYELLAIAMRLGQAEIAMARGDRTTSRSLVDAARRRVPPDVWVLQRRLETLDILDALAAGDRDRARTRWSQLRERAQTHGDGITLAEMDALARDPRFGVDGPGTDSRVATSLPGATLDWLTGTSTSTATAAVAR